MRTQIFIIQLILFIILIYTLYHASKTKNTASRDKNIIAVLSILILGLHDKMKLLFWGLAVSIIFIIKFLISKKKEEHGRSA